jgi:hypothetical protein
LAGVPVTIQREHGKQQKDRYDDEWIRKIDLILAF